MPLCDNDSDSNGCAETVIIKMDCRFCGVFDAKKINSIRFGKTNGRLFIAIA